MIVFYLCVLCSIGLATGRQDIYCSGGCNVRAPSKYCTATAIEKPPWSKVGEKTAPKPELFKVGYYLFNVNEEEVGIALNITWKSKVATLRKLIKGYYLFVSKPNMMGSFKYRFDLSGMKDFKSKRKKVYFNYECVGKNVSFIRPGDTVTVEIQSLPCYQENHDSQHVKRDIQIPDCSKKKMLKTWHCSSSYSEYYTEYVYERQISNPPEDPSDVHAKKPSSNYAVIVLPAATGGALLALVIAAIIYLTHLAKGRFHKTHNQTNEIVKGSCLVLVESSSEDSSSPHKEAAHLLAEILHRDARLKVDCNLWRQTQMQEPVKWSTEALAASQHVVLVASHKPTLNCNLNQLDEPFQIGLAALLQSQRAIHIPFLHKQSFHFVYFGSDRQQVLPRELSSFRQSYPLMRDFGRFYKALTNRPPNTADPQLRKSLSDVIDRLRHLEESRAETTRLCPELDPEGALSQNGAQDANVVPCIQGDEAASSGVAFYSGFSSGSVNCWSHETSVSCQGSQCSCNFNSVEEQLVSCL